MTTAAPDTAAVAVALLTYNNAETVKTVAAAAAATVLTVSALL